MEGFEKPFHWACSLLLLRQNNRGNYDGPDLPESEVGIAIFNKIGYQEER
jgi:hypothetical protein